MDRDTLALVLASTIGGLAVLLATVSLVYQPLLLPASLPLAAAAYLMWQGALGRVGRGRVRWQRVDPDGRAAGDYADQSHAGRTRAAPGFGANRGPAGSRRRNATTDTGRYRPPGDPSGGEPGDPSRDRARAYRVLGLDPGADEAAVRQAYRERVKEVHPDADGGDEAAFKRVNRAYELLTDG